MSSRPVRIFDPAASCVPELHELRARFDEFVRAGVYMDGAFVTRFEQAVAERLGIAYAVACASGTSAIVLALQAAGIGHGDEVVTVANTYYATTWAVRHVGATPVFVDIERRTGQIDAAQVPAALTPRTAAILAVHLYGWPAPSAALRAIADRYGLLLVEDCAHAFGGGPPGQAYGSRADFACFSFYPTKPLGGFGDGGLVATPDRDAADRIRRLRYFADDSRTRFTPQAQSARLDDLQAALLLVRLAGFDARRAARLERAGRYQAGLAVRPDCLLALTAADASPYVFPVRVADRPAFLAAMRTRQIHAGVHYATDLHRLAEFGTAPAGSLPETERHNAEVVSLPVHEGLSPADQDDVCAAVLELLGS